VRPPPGPPPSPRSRPLGRWLGILGVALVLAPGPARPVAAEAWGGLTPGISLRRDVEALYGKPSRERAVVEEGRTALEWTYAGERAPGGVERMVVSFGLLRGGAFEPDLVRAISVYPRPHVFSLRAITNGWGTPDGIGTEEATGRPSLHYRTRGLLIVLDRTGSWAELLLFAPPQDGSGS
jgi:hypothetical protein